MSVLIIPAAGPLQKVALGLLYSALPAGQREQQIAETLAAAGRSELSLDNLLVAVDGARAMGSVLFVLRPGGAAFLWPPAAEGVAAPPDLASALLAAAVARAEAQGAQFIQCLLDPGDSANREMLNRGAIPYATDLILLSRSLLERTADLPSGSPGTPSLTQPPASCEELSFESYSPAARSAFSRLVERTYVGTLDCPVLARVRGGEDSLEAHRATGRFVPDAWRVYRERGEAVGIVILAEHPERDTWEVAYLGVVPEARGRGLGRAILQDGLAVARRSGRSTVEIAVDAANTPAIRLYHRLGFKDVRRFAVHLRVTEPSRGAGFPICSDIDPGNTP